MFSEMSNMTIVLMLIQSWLGIPYKWGGDDPIQGFDCSGSMIEILLSLGLVKKGFDTTAQGLYDMFPKVQEGNQKFGDFAVYGSGKVTHIVLVLNSKLKFEFGGGGSATNTEADAAKQNAYGRIRPIKARSDLIGYCRPPISWN